MSGFGFIAQIRQAFDEAFDFAHYISLVRPEDIMACIFQTNYSGGRHTCFKRGCLVAFHLVSRFRGDTVGGAIWTLDRLERKDRPGHKNGRLH